MLTLLLLGTLTVGIDVQLVKTEVGTTFVSDYGRFASPTESVSSMEPLVTEWSKTYGGAGVDIAYSVIETSDGGYALVGGLGGGTLARARLIKTNSFGNHEWNKTYGGPYTCVFSVVETSDGGYAMAGCTRLSEIGRIDDEAWFLKTDSSGNMQWNQTYGGTKNDRMRCVVETSDGGYALAGYTASFAETGWHFWLVKTDSSGNMQWNKTYSIEGMDRPYSVVQTNDGGYVLAGYVEKPFDAKNFWLVKVDSSGNHEWNKTYGGTSDDTAFSVVETSDGGYALAGYTKSFATAGDEDFWLVKVDSYGNHQWNKTYSGSGDDGASSVVETSDGGYAIAGTTDSYGAGWYDFWLIKTDQNGTTEWNKTFGGPDREYGQSVALTSDGGYALAGYTESIGAGDFDFWLVKVGSHPLIDVFPKDRYSCPDYAKPKNYDINGDGISDWFYEATTDDIGRSVEIWGVDQDGRQNSGTTGDPFDEYFAVMFGDTTGKYFIGWCSFEGGYNHGTITHTGDANVNERPDCFVQVQWRSTDKGKFDEQLLGQDTWEYTYNVVTRNLTRTHYDKDGNIVYENVAEPEKWQSPGSFHDLEPGDVMVDFEWVGEVMTAGPYYLSTVGGIWIPVNKLELLTPYIGLTILLAVAATTVAYVKKRRETMINS